MLARLCGVWAKFSSGLGMALSAFCRITAAPCPPSKRLPPSDLPRSMSTSELSGILSKLHTTPLPSPEKISSLLSSAKRQLLQLNALLPTPSTTPQTLALARQTLETGAILSIRLQNPDAFTRYFQQLSPFYELPSSSYSPQNDGQRNKVTGLYLLLLLTKGDYAEFHTVLEGLEVEFADAGKRGLEDDEFIGYPVKLERWLMEGSYDRVWKATGRESVPGEEFGIFREVCSFTLYKTFTIQES